MNFRIFNDDDLEKFLSHFFMIDSKVNNVSVLMMENLLLALVIAFKLFRLIGGEPTEATIVAYPNEVYSERDLLICPDYTACNIVYKRFWLPTKVERLCRCKSFECSTIWEKGPKERSLIVDNRTQLKFCDSLRSLPRCSGGEALEMADKLNHTRREFAYIGHHDQLSHGSKAASAKCTCHEPYSWFPLGNNTFGCSKLKFCQENNICGYVRTDIFSTSYTCSCPTGQQCVAKDKQIEKKQLLLYDGTVYTARCTVVKN